MQDVSTRAIALEKTMEFGISLNEVTDRDMHDDWAKFKELKKQFDDKFEEWICTSPEKLKKILDEMERLHTKVSCKMLQCIFLNVIHSCWNR